MASRQRVGVLQSLRLAILFKGCVSGFYRPARGVCLALLLKACLRDLRGLRDAALLRVAYDSAGRRSELVAIRAEHIERDAEGAGTLFIPPSKTDQAGEGAYAYLAPAPMVAIARWRDAGHIARGALFRDRTSTRLNSGHTCADRMPD